MISENPTVAVIGLGYIGLPTAAVLATHGANVVGVDINQNAVDMINAGKIHIVEPGLEEAVADAVAAGKLRAQLHTPAASAFIVAVPTPFKGNYEPDLSYIESAADGIAQQLTGGELIILESTSPPGATKQLADRIIAARPDLSLDGADGRRTIYVAHCPERVLPGQIMTEIIENDRIVGGLTPESAQRAKSLYALFCSGEIHITDARTAEMTKLVENAYRDVNIAFANELSILSDEFEIDVWELIRLANRHPRVNILKPGPGVGGHCIAVDPWFLIDAAPNHTPLIKTARAVNSKKEKFVVNKIADLIGTLKSERVSILGLAFKPNVGDLRESPALRIVAELAQRFPMVHISISEPHIEDLPAELRFANTSLRPTEEVISRTDLIVKLVDHDAYQSLSLQDSGIPSVSF